jgi:hypothetical protein
MIADSRKLHPEIAYLWMDNRYHIRQTSANFIGNRISLYGLSSGGKSIIFAAEK